MEIKINYLTPITFKDLKYGDVFTTDDTGDDVYLVLSGDYGLGMEKEFEGYAAEVKTGEIYGFYNSDPVIKLSAKLTATIPTLE